MQTLAPSNYVAPAPPPPTGTAVGRALRALFLERRLPYRLQLVWDGIATRIGLQQKWLRAAGLKLRVRRGTSDVAFVTNVIESREYTCDGFEIHPDQVVIDIGGNIGTFALLAAQRGARVITVEPGSDNFELLKRNIEVNGAARVTPINAAVCKDTGTITLERSHEGGYHSTTKGMLSNPVGSETVKAVRLQDLFDTYGIKRCHFLKVDCEGAEYEIFEGLPDEYLARVDKIAMEWHGVEDHFERIQRANWLAQRLVDRGFRLDLYRQYIGFRSGMIRAIRT